MITCHVSGVRFFKRFLVSRPRADCLSRQAFVPFTSPSNPLVLYRPRGLFSFASPPLQEPTPRDFAFFSTRLEGRRARNLPSFLLSLLLGVACFASDQSRNSENHLRIISRCHEFTRTEYFLPSSKSNELSCRCHGYQFSLTHSRRKIILKSY